MHVELEQDRWVLSEIGDVEWFMLLQLPEAADASSSAKGRHRLFPDIVDLSDHPEIQEDWRQFVEPEIQDRFSREIETVSADLAAAEETFTGDAGIVRRLSVSQTHTENWYSVLNQARLILNEEHGIARTERSLVTGDLHPSEIEETQWLLLVQYRVYAAIQEFLLREFME